MDRGMSNPGNNLQGLSSQPGSNPNSAVSSEVGLHSAHPRAQGAGQAAACTPEHQRTDNSEPAESELAVSALVLEG